MKDKSLGFFRDVARSIRHPRPLDKYIFSEFWKIFVITALGFPVLFNVIDLTDNIDKYLSRNLPYGNIALSYVYKVPEAMFTILPAAVLFATVFSIGAFTRHSEITAAKASGISFYRFIAPILLGAVIATGLGIVLGEISPHFNKRGLELLENQKYAGATDRYNFAYAAENGRVYKVGALHITADEIQTMQIERKGSGPDYPSYVLTSNTAHYDAKRTGGDDRRSGWVLSSGAMHLIPDSLSATTFVFDSLYDRRFTERPTDLTNLPKAPSEMAFRELGRFITAMERSGADVNKLRVERMLKVVIPITCMVIVLFGAPLATSNQRGGAAYGIGISLATTVIFLMLIQLTKAIGGNGIIPPDLAAWLPSLIFGSVGAFMLSRVRT